MMDVFMRREDKSKREKRPRDDTKMWASVVMERGLQETNPANTLALDFQPSKWQENNFHSFNHPILYYGTQQTSIDISKSLNPRSFLDQISHRRGVKIHPHYYEQKKHVNLQVFFPRLSHSTL
jgi:hypothetical protein